MASETGAQSIDRAAQILVRLMESAEAVTLAGVMEDTQLPKSTAARLLRALERNGLAQRRPGGGFRPGPALVDYAHGESPVGDLATLAVPYLEALEQATGETTNVAIPTPTGVARIAQVDSHHPLGAGNWVGPRIPPHASSMGKVFMAFGAAQPPFGRLAKLAPSTITNIADLLHELEEVRRRGYATTWEELEAGLCSTAAPVRGSKRTVIAAISISAPTVRTTRERLAELSGHVVRTADALSAHIRATSNGRLNGSEVSA
jgi:IclR family transcriptional regulator, acetate operon repressor